MIASCDMPFITVKLLTDLLKNHHRKCKVTLCRLLDGNPEPFPGIYESRLCPLISKCLDIGRLSMQDFLMRILEKRVLAVEPPFREFLNVNEKKDIAHAYAGPHPQSTLFVDQVSFQISHGWQPESLFAPVRKG
jgi:molybdopterin-guanine dinucleotide biosynthesis protein A